MDKKIVPQPKSGFCDRNHRKFLVMRLWNGILRFKSEKINLSNYFLIKTLFV